MGRNLIVETGKFRSLEFIVLLRSSFFVAQRSFLFSDHPNSPTACLRKRVVSDGAFQICGPLFFFCASGVRKADQEALPGLGRLRVPSTSFAFQATVPSHSVRRRVGTLAADECHVVEDTAQVTGKAGSVSTGNSNSIVRGLS